MVICILLSLYFPLHIPTSVTKEEARLLFPFVSREVYLAIEMSIAWRQPLVVAFVFKSLEFLEGAFQRGVCNRQEIEVKFSLLVTVQVTQGFLGQHMLFPYSGIGSGLAPFVRSLRQLLGILRYPFRLSFWTVRCTFVRPGTNTAILPSRRK